MGAAFAGAKTAAPIVLKGTKKTAGMILGTLGAMGGEVLHQADKMAKKMERGRKDLVNVEEEGQPRRSAGRKNIARLKPVATQNASMIGRIMQYQFVFKILFAILFFAWVYRTTGSFF